MRRATRLRAAYRHTTESGSLTSGSHGIWNMPFPGSLASSLNSWITGESSPHRQETPIAPIVNARHRDQHNQHRTHIADVSMHVIALQLGRLPMPRSLVAVRAISQ